MLHHNATKTHTPFQPVRLRVLASTFLIIAFCAIASPSAFASYISSNVLAVPPSGPSVTQGTGTPGQVVQASVDAQNYAQALTNYGVNKAFATSSQYPDYAQASSDWVVNFSLSGNGLAPNTYIPLIISYMYDFSITSTAGFGSPSTGYNVSGGFGISANNVDQGHPYDVFFVGATSNADGSVESCKSKEPGGATPQECLGFYSGSGDLVVLNDFYVGQNRLESILTMAAAIGTSDGYNTAIVTGIIVPDGITWTYDSDITGNPLNFHYATSSVSPVPEPGTLGILGIGLAALCAARVQKTRRAVRAGEPV